jgi:hypothetical protein
MLAKSSGLPLFRQCVFPDGSRQLMHERFQNAAQTVVLDGTGGVVAGTICARPPFVLRGMDTCDVEQSGPRQMFVHLG